MIHDVHDELVSHPVRQGREICCHDISTAVRNDRATYASALVVIDALRGSLPPGIM